MLKKEWLHRQTQKRGGVFLVALPLFNMLVLPKHYFMVTSVLYF